MSGLLGKSLSKLNLGKSSARNPVIAVIIVLRKNNTDYCTVQRNLIVMCIRGKEFKM